MPSINQEIYIIVYEWNYNEVQSTRYTQGKEGYIRLCHETSKYPAQLWEKNLVEQIKLYVYSIKCAIESSSEPSSCSQEVDLASCICMTLGKILNPKLFSSASNGV